MSSRPKKMAVDANINGQSWDQDSMAPFASLLETFYLESRQANKMKRILKSLHLEQLQQRHSEIKYNNKHTFGWIFANNSSVNLAQWFNSGDGI